MIQTDDCRKQASSIQTCKQTSLIKYSSSSSVQAAHKFVVHRFSSNVYRCRHKMYVKLWEKESERKLYINGVLLEPNKLLFVPIWKEGIAHLSWYWKPLNLQHCSSLVESFLVVKNLNYANTNLVLCFSMIFLLPAPFCDVFIKIPS